MGTGPQTPLTNFENKNKAHKKMSLSQLFAFFVSVSIIFYIWHIVQNCHSRDWWFSLKWWPIGRHTLPILRWSKICFQIVNGLWSLLQIQIIPVQFGHKIIGYPKKIVLPLTCIDALLWHASAFLFRFIEVSLGNEIFCIFRVFFPQAWKRM